MIVNNKYIYISIKQLQIFFKHWKLESGFVLLEIRKSQDPMCSISDEEVDK